MSHVPFRFQFDLPPDNDADDGATEQAAQDNGSPSPASSPALASNVPEEESREVSKRRPFELLPDCLLLLEERRRNNENVCLTYDEIAMGGDSVAPLRRVCSNATPKDVQQQHSESDLLTGVYEGGLKVWECSADLCRYLALHWKELLTRKDTQPSRVLELGCGHGLPGCLIVREAVKGRLDVRVFFTDYNDFVLRDVTLSNILLNTPEGFTNEDVLKHVMMGAGDWMELSKQLTLGKLHDADSKGCVPPNGRFDLILAAETTYTTESARDTATLMVKHLEPISGVGLVATKRYYFGVGGGSDAFKEAADQQVLRRISDDESETEYHLSVETIETYDNGTSNIRDLLCVRCRPRP